MMEKERELEVLRANLESERERVANLKLELMLPNGSTAKLSSVPNSTDFETVDEVETPTSYCTEL